jgi:hypothetical protein
MLSYGTRVRVRKPTDLGGKDPSTSETLWWVSKYMDQLDGTEHVTDHPDPSEPWVRLKGISWKFAMDWLEVVSADATVSSGSGAPRNNDGRSECFWCHVQTAKRGGGTYDVCPKCGR